MPDLEDNAWNEVLCNWGSNGYRLPTEAEWEYAALGGCKSKGYMYSGSDNIDRVAWYSCNSRSKMHRVGKKMANELCIFDMSGNVWEWCWDRWGEYYCGDQTNPIGPTKNSSRLLRGGSWHFMSTGCRVKYRASGFPYHSYDSYGFRLCRAMY